MRFPSPPHLAVPLAVLAACLGVGCEVSAGGLAPRLLDGAAGFDAGRADASFDGAARDDGARPDRNRIDGGVVLRDGGPGDGGTGSPMDPIVLGEVRGRDSHPVIAYNGRQLLVGVLTAGGLERSHVDVHYFDPGVPDPVRSDRLTAAPLSRSSLSLAPRDEGRLAVAWMEHRIFDWHAVLRVDPDFIVPATVYSDVLDADDQNDVQVVWEPEGAVVVVRAAVGTNQKLISRRVTRSAAVSNEGWFEMDHGLGELTSSPRSTRALVTVGQTGSVWVRDERRWVHGISVANGFDQPDEGDVAERADGALSAVWSWDTVGGSPLTYHRFEGLGSALTEPAPPRWLDFHGHDPAIATTGNRALLAWARQGGGLGLSMLDEAGIPMGDACLVPGRALVNDPDVACSDRFCGVVWMEANHPDDPLFQIRMVQVSPERPLSCP